MTSASGQERSRRHAPYQVGRCVPTPPAVCVAECCNLRASLTKVGGAVRTPRPTSIGLVLLCTMLAGVQGADWPQFLGPNRNGSCPAPQIALAWPKEGPPQLWQRKVGEGFAGPVVSDGKLILFHRVGDKETVESLDSATGRPIWKSDYPTHYRDDFGFDEGPRATPSVAAGRVFTYGADGLLSCWDLATGAKQWSVDTVAEFHSGKGFFGRAPSPLVEGKAVIVDVGGRPGAGIVAFEAATGKV